MEPSAGNAAPMLPASIGLTGQIVAEQPVSDFIVGESAPERKTVFVVCSSPGIGIRIVVECRVFLVGTAAPVV